MICPAAGEAFEEYKKTVQHRIRRFSRARSIHSGCQIVLVEHKLLAKHSPKTADDYEEIGRVMGVYDVETAPHRDPNTERRHGSQCVRIFEAITDQAVHHRWRRELVGGHIAELHVVRLALGCRA